jgi:hypothetical protein
VSAARPTPAEERWHELAVRLGKPPGTAPFAQRSGAWRRARLPTRCALFLAGQVAAVMAYVVLDLLHAPFALSGAGVAEIVLAEWLIRQRRLYASGIEEALELSGLLLIGYDLVSAGVGFPAASITWVVAAAFAIAGARLLNALFMTVAAIACVAAIVYNSGLHSPWLELHDGRIASLLCYLIAIAALAAGARTYSRPAHDRMLDWLVVAMPVAGYLWSAGVPTDYVVADYRHDHSLYTLYTPLAPLAFGALALFTGLRRRTHAPVLAAMLCAACVAYELRSLSGWPYQVRFMVWGAVLLVAAIVVERWLRRPRRGITSLNVGAGSETADLLQLAGAAVIAPQAQAAPAPSFKGGGGGFGGGGASGQY